MTEVLQILNSIGAVLQDDHFVYSSGKHGSIYINKNDVFAYTTSMETLGRMIAERHRHLDIDTVAGPAMCGVIPANRVAYNLCQLQNKEVVGVFAEANSSKEFHFLRGYEKFISGKNVLIVDDITTSGATLKKVIQVVGNLGGNVVGASVIVNRNPTGVDSFVLGVPFDALLSLEIPAYEESECQLCKSGVPVNTIYGHGSKYAK